MRSTVPIALPENFEWTPEAWGWGLRCTPLAQVAPHVFSTRQLSFPSEEGEQTVAAAVGARELATTVQNHGTEVAIVGEPFPEVADILVSCDADRAVGVRSADCAPILIAARQQPVVAAVHAGWRGTAAGAVGAAVALLEQRFGVRPDDLVAAIGPCIGACCYEVGSELVDAFASAGHGRHLVDRWFHSPPQSRGSRARPPLHLDIALANRDQLVLAGLDEANVNSVGLCTAMHLDMLTSYRVERDRACRMVAAIRPHGSRSL